MQFFLVRVWLKWRSRPQDRIVGLTSVLSLKQFSFISYVLFHTLLDPLHSAPAPCPSTSPSLLFRSTSTSTTTPANRVVVWSTRRTIPSYRLRAQRSAANPLLLFCLREGAVSNRMLMISDASEACGRSDVGRLVSPLFLQEREVSANPCGAIFFSPAFKHREAKS